LNKAFNSIPTEEQEKHLPAAKQQGTEGRTNHRIAPKKCLTSFLKSIEADFVPDTYPEKLQTLPNVTAESLLIKLVGRIGRIG
jgi:hypothetical protein